jgi:hypothetical protein
MILRIALFAILASLPQSKGQQLDKTKDSAANAQRGTAKSPVVVKVVPAEKDTAETNREARDQADHARKEGIAAYSTLASAVLTLALAIATGILALYTWRLWKTTSEMVGKSDVANAENAEKMERNIAESAKAASAMTLSADATESMFYATHPPEIIIDDVHFVKGTETIVYSIENNGGSDSTILQSNVSRRLHYIGERLPKPLPYSDDRNTLGRTSYDLGVRIEHKFDGDPKNLDVTFAELDTARCRIALFGFIEYQGPNGKRFTNTFYRINDPETGYFIVLDPTYERTH